LSESSAFRGDGLVAETQQKQIRVVDDADHTIDTRAQNALGLAERHKALFGLES
jgi:hypothetical protein